MSSCVFYRFKNSKDRERIFFDGKSITVFELKRDIIKAAGLGDGSDFNLHLYPVEDPDAEYEDDTTIISRSSEVIAIRRPAPRGHGRAARYVAGRAPVRALKKTDSSTPAVSSTASGALSEQDAEAAFLAESEQAWQQQKEQLSHAKPVYHKKKPVNVPAHDPPPGYVCYRCQKKGHWIQVCPTNDDPDFKPVARAKRTTGIPRSFLKTVEKPPEGDLEDARGVMLNADGEYVKVMVDTKSWEKFQQKATAVKAQAASADADQKEMEKRGLLCPIDERLFNNPVKTPCCETTYCHDCIENTLLDRDLVCPNCEKVGVIIEELVPDEDMVGRIRDYEAEKARERLEKERQGSEEVKPDAKPSSPSEMESNVPVPTITDDAKASDAVRTGSESPAPNSNNTEKPAPILPSPHTVAAKPTSSSTPNPNGNGSDSDTSTTSKKRKEAPTEIRAPTAPKAMRLQKEQQSRQTQDQSSAVEKSFIDSMEALKNMPSNAAMMPNIPMPPMPMGMPGNPMMGMMNPNMNAMNAMNPMANMNMNAYGNVNPGWNNFNNGYPNPNQFNNMGFNDQMNGYPNMGYGNMGGMQGNMHGGYNNGGWGNQGYNQMGYGNQGAQQDAYERRPLNPHRSQNKNRKQRSADFHYVHQS
ncbi:DWNN-domain-containing protein [Westerdykella ornata]|uniref:DWNN-domain-containing protein n=1 Tax=Westerdykella ornata TaxID=318751 RepID=A0A6A6J7L0_WESOR|nr:DWNN-domain-containing protein [Westerdykella ornata]KAF2272197.1 DWNN-domain-containing protein [Westerdykella ornata]